MDTIDFGPATRTLAGLVGEVTDDQLDNPTPCPKWTTADLLRHIGGLTLEFTAAAQKVPTPARAGDGLTDGWRQRIQDDLVGLAAAWEDGGAYEGETHAGPVTMPEAARPPGSPSNEVTATADYAADPAAVAECVDFVQEVRRAGERRRSACSSRRSPPRSTRPRWTGWSGWSAAIRPPDGSRRSHIVSSRGQSDDEPVADPGLGEQVAGSRRVGFELAAQLVGIHPEVVQLASVRGSPGGAEQLGMRDEVTRAPRQCLQQSPLGRREPDLGAVRGGRPSLADVEGEVVGGDDQWFGALGRTAAHGGPDPGEELVHAERLGDVVVGAGVEGLDLVVGVVPGGEDDHRDLGHVAKPPEHLDAVEVRQAEVEDDDVGGAFGEDLQRGAAVRGGLDLVVRALAG